MIGDGEQTNAPCYNLFSAVPIAACMPASSHHLVWCYYSLLGYLLTGMQWNVNSLPC